MGYIQTSNGIPEFSKAVISFWFRVPQDTITRARDAETEPGALFAGIIPLLVMGKPGSGDIPYTPVFSKTVYYNTTSYQALGLGNDHQVVPVGPPRFRSTYTYNPNAYIVPVTGKILGDIMRLSIDGTAPPTHPTFIGLSAYDRRLVVSFETNQIPVVAGGWMIHDSVTPGSNHGHGPSPYAGEIPSQPGPHDAYPIGTYIHEYDMPAGTNDVVIEDTTGWQQWPVTETITTKAVHNYSDVSDTIYATTGRIYSDTIEVTPDHWHHVLISVELQTVESHGNGGSYTAEKNPRAQWVGSAAKLHVAVDDVNYTEYDLATYWNEGGDPNEVVTEDAASIAGSRPDTDFDGKFLTNPTYLLVEPKVAAKGTALGLPATAEYIANIYKVELAELQIFTGVTLDTGDVASRRAFVDRNGKPVPPVPKVDTKGNVIPSPAAKLLGKGPEVLLHGSSNWSKGKNTGTLGIDSQGKPIMSGQFGPVGKILAWRPDPTLHGPQGPQTPLPPSIRLSRESVAAEQD